MFRIDILGENSERLYKKVGSVETLKDLQSFIYYKSLDNIITEWENAKKEYNEDFNTEDLMVTGISSNWKKLHGPEDVTLERCSNHFKELFNTHYDYQVDIECSCVELSQIMQAKKERLEDPDYCKKVPLKDRFLAYSCEEEFESTVSLVYLIKEI